MLFILRKNYFNFKCYYKYSHLKKFRTSNICFSSESEKKFIENKAPQFHELSPKYDFKEIEKTWYEWWERQKLFEPTKNEAESFVLLLPPPNITGTLHLGHVLTATIQDVIIRWKRMNGQSVLWIPGIDHAGIATQVIVEKNLKQTLGITKHNLGKKEFIKKTWDWKCEHEKKIYEQLRSIGASLDWNRAKFTLDPDHSNLVSTSFIKLHEKGLIYRNRSLLNWSCALKSSISDIEIDWHNITQKTKFNIPGYDAPVEFGIMYKIAYKICNSDEEIIVHTTRPETMIGDVAIAVHPDDPMYTKYHNQMVWHPFRCEKIPILLDNFVNPNKGSGAVKITPSHSHEDFEMGLRQNLKSIDVINEEGLINNVGQNKKLFGLKRYKARQVIIDELTKLNLFRGAYEHSMVIPLCSRSGDVVEHLIKSQWFLKCKSLATDAINLVKNGELKLVPKNYEKVWFDWLKKCNDWNLSRQLWWGHQIPMYSCKVNEKKIWIGALNMEEAKIKASKILEVNTENIEITQDSDVLDTWFSSGLLPLGLLSSTKPSNHLPISLMVTGYDILFFWVARMVFLSRALTGSLPFNEVLLHGLICDSKGRKMSKSLGNIIRPEDVVNGRKLEDMKNDLKKSFEKGFISRNEFKIALATQNKMFPQGIPDCGMDALRFSLCTFDFQCASVNFDVQICHSNRHFCNKIWQAFKYFVKIIEEYKITKLNDPILNFEFNNLNYEKLNVLDKWILSRTAHIVNVVNSGISSNRFSIATNSIKAFVTDEFCGVYLECCKTLLRNDSSQYEKIILIFLRCLDTYLKLLSPFMPFVTEHLYQFLPPFKGFEKFRSITIAEFPKWDIWRHHYNEDLEQNIKIILQILSSVRSTVIAYDLTPKNSRVYLKCQDYLEELICGEISLALANLGKVKQFLPSRDHCGINVIERIIDNNTVAYVEHEYDKETLIKKLSPRVKEEEKIKALVKNLKATKVKKEESKKMTPTEINDFEKKIRAFEEKLTKIEEFKRVIASCQ